MFSKLDKIKYKKTNSSFQIKIDELSEGINNLEDYIVYKDKEINVYDRICNHSGGKIISRKNEHICPNHNWKFYPEKGCYSNGIKKKKLEYLTKNNSLIIDKIKLTPEIKKLSNNESDKLKIRFFNHAFLHVEGKNFSFATDPWAIGPAFSTGWWLKHKTKSDWIEKLNQCSFIYISHNHPDHLNPLTLSKVDKNIPIIVANFRTDSAGIYCESLGFKNVIRIDFEQQYQLEKTNLIFTIFKSGDFREDSGIYFSHNKITALFDVDSNIINFKRFPMVDIYATSFAGGASGYPLMFDNYKEDEQIQIAKKNKNFTLKKNINYLEEIKPKFFLPYAGFFDLRFNRDKRIKKLIQRNSITDYQNGCKRLNIELLNVEKFDQFTFKNCKLKSSEIVKKKYFVDLNENDYLKFYKKEYSNINYEFIKEYFKNSKFKDNLLLYISLVSDNFSKSFKNYKIDFSNDIINVEKIDKIKKISKINSENKKILILKCRKESFLNIVYNKLPWEDILIGFQCKVIRSPNEYNTKFWHHFTNVYTTDKNVRLTNDCSSCMKINQFFDNKIFKKDALSKQVNS
jgi:CMP-N-acetylneuraminate monooxygenase